jgi:CubicO group peptidase (beta-lactamase class C family)
MLIHKLADDGLINLLDPVAHYVPEFGQHGKDRINIIQVLTHRGGVPGIPATEHFTNLGNHAHQLQLICNAQPIDRYGRTPAYHAITGGTVLQAVLERVTGQSIARYWDENFKQPMGLRYFGYGANKRDFPRMARDHVTGAKIAAPMRKYFKQYLGLDFELERDLFNDYSFFAKPIPAGNMIATAEEANRFFQMLLDDGRYVDKQIVSHLAVQRATMETMPHRMDSVLKLPIRCSPGMMLGGSPFGLYGPETGQAFGHVGLINTFIWADPERDLTVSLLTTGKPVIAHNALPLMQLLRRINTRVPHINRPA